MAGASLRELQSQDIQSTQSCPVFVLVFCFP